MPVPAPEDMPASGRPDQRPAPRQQREYSIEIYSRSNSMDVETALLLQEVFYQAYRGARPKEDFNPQKLVVQVRQGTCTSLVVRDDLGNIVGHGALIEKGEGMLELGRLFIAPGTQGQNLSERLRDGAIMLVNDLVAQGAVEVVYTNAVTSHPVTQELFDEVGYKPSGFFDRMRTDFFKTGKRESLLRTQKIYNPEIRKKRTVYIPHYLKNVAATVYKIQECSRTIKTAFPNGWTGESGNGPGSQSKFDMENFDLGAVTLSVAADEEVQDLLTDTNLSFKIGAKHVSARIDLTSPQAIQQLNALKMNGFYFAALETTAESDYIVMQKAAGSGITGICSATGKLLTEESQELLAAIRLLDSSKALDTR